MRLARVCTLCCRRVSNAAGVDLPSLPHTQAPTTLPHRRPRSTLSGSPRRASQRSVRLFAQLAALPVHAAPPQQAAELRDHLC